MALSPSEILLEIYNKLKEFAIKGETPVKSLVLSLFVYAVKQFFKENIYSCPVQNYLVYGNLFIYGPAVVLFCLSLLISESFWRFTTGGCCCRRVIWSKSRKSIYLAILPPFVWLILAFADAHFYVCAQLGPFESAKAAANSSSALEKAKLKFSNARTHSQIISWVLLLSLMVIATIVLTVDRCCSKFGSKIIRQDEFDEIEANYAMKLYNERIKPLAEERAKTSVDQLFQAYKDEKPGEICEIATAAEDYLLTVYPKHASVGSCVSPPSTDHRSSKFKELFKKRGKNVEDDEVGLTESGPQQHYTSIN
ncbi:calcium homeostasis modulator protein 6-like [Actinia tenebrosa]|uniref:Calcium homeostasis modulator protein 6-like n=1 Tax=Actinia tenebrosa TaxID=6105 RepID=A0A6P8IBX9_ACTTE|nr:calcium homeostasis modulator protein 6-like [Actinia tenebrosa]